MLHMYNQLGSYEQYVAYVNTIERLTDEQEVQLLQCVQRGKVERFQSCPDKQVLEAADRARFCLVDAFQRLILRIARQRLQHFQSMTLLDLVQEGNIGFLRALDEYNPYNGCPFRRAAGRYISGAIWEARCRFDAMVRLPEDVHTKLSKIKKASYRLQGDLERQPSVDEIAREVGMSSDDLYDLFGYQCQQHAESLQGMLLEDEDEDRRDFVSLFQASIVDEQARQTALAVALRKAMQEVITDRQRDVLELHYSFDGVATSARPKEMVADMLGMAQQNINKFERGAMKRLYKVLAPMKGIQSDYYSPDEVMQVLGISRSCYYYRLYAGNIPGGERCKEGQATWRFSRSVIDALVCTGHGTDESEAA